MTRKYVWMAYTTGPDGAKAQVQAVARKREELADLIGVTVEGPVPADMYPVGKVFALIEAEPA